MTIGIETIVITAGTSVANAQGTAVSTRPVIGEVVQVRNPGTALGGTCDYTLTRLSDGGTVWAGANVGGPFEFNPVLPTHLNSGTTLSGTASVPGVPCNSHLQLVIGSAAASAAGTLHVYYRY